MAFRKPIALASVLAIFAITSLCLIVKWPSSRCGPKSEYEVRISGDYWLFKAGSYAICIVKGPDPSHFDIVVDPMVVLIGVDNNLIVGMIGTSPDPAFLEEFEFNSTPGYFVIDTTTDTITLGLTEDECRQVLETHKAKWPALVHPDLW